LELIVKLIVHYIYSKYKFLHIFTCCEGNFGIWWARMDRTRLHGHM